MKTINITLSIAIFFSLFHCNEEKNNLPPRIVNPLENRTLQAGFGTDTMDIQKVFNDPNDDKLFFNATSSDDEVVSATIFQNSQLIIREGRAGKAKITLTANDAHRTTATDTLEVTIIKNVPENQPPMVVNPLENKTLQAGFGTDTMDIQHVFNDPNDDALTFNAHSSDDSVIAVTIFQNNQLVIREGKVGKSKITLTANDVQGATATDTLEVNIIENVPENRPFMCNNTVKLMESNDFNTIKSRDEFDILSVKIENDSLKVTISYGGGCADNQQFCLVGDNSVTMDSEIPRRSVKLIFIEEDPCEAAISKNHSFDIRNLKLQSNSRIFLMLEKWSDDILYEEKNNQPPMVVNPLENRTLQEGFGTDMVDIQNVFNDPNDDVLTFNAHSSNDEVVSVTILQNNQLVISEVGVGIATITLTADDGQGGTVSGTFQVSVNNIAEVDLGELCAKILSKSTGECSGEKIGVLDNPLTANLEFSSEIGYFFRYTVPNTIDCVLIFNICDNSLFDQNMINTSFSFTGTIYSYTGNYKSSIGGIKIYVISNENNNQPPIQDVFTENATIHYDKSGIDNCVYTIAMDSKAFYTVDELDDDFNENNLRVKISYKVTEEGSSCGFGGYLPKIEIITIKKI